MDLIPLKLLPLNSIIGYKYLAKKLLKVDNKYLFCVFGISSSAKDYRICHFLNKELPLNLIPKEDVTIENKRRNQNFIMNRFCGENILSISNFHLINNKCNGEIFIKSMKNVDYFLLVEGEILKSELLLVKKALQNIKIIEHFIEVDGKEFNGMEHFIFENDTAK